MQLSPSSPFFIFFVFPTTFMASSLHPTLTFLTLTFPKRYTPIFTAKSYTPIRCGPRGNRGPLVKGRVLSIEAIQAVQSLKRAQNPTDDVVSKTLSRLIKADLIAALNELLRQDRIDLALKVFSAVRSEYKVEVAMYADMILGLSKKMMWEDVDRLVCDLESGGVIGCEESKGVVRLIKALVENGRVDSTVRIYGLLKKSGWGQVGGSVDEYLVRVLSRGLRRLGEVGLADEAEKEFGWVPEDNLGKLAV